MAHYDISTQVSSAEALPPRWQGFPLSCSPLTPWHHTLPALLMVFNKHLLAEWCIIHHLSVPGGPSGSCNPRVSLAEDFLR